MRALNVLLFTAVIGAVVLAPPPRAHAQLRHIVITDAWLRVDTDIAIYRNPKTEVRFAGLFSGLLSYTGPGDGPAPSLLAGLQLGDRYVDFAALGGVNILGTTPRALVGGRFWGRPGRHVTVWNETLFYVGAPASGPAPKVLSQFEVGVPVTKDHRVDIGGKLLAEINLSQPRLDTMLLAGAFLQVWLLPETEGRKNRGRPYISAAYKIGPYWREDHLHLGHEIEVELVYWFRWL